MMFKLTEEEVRELCGLLSSLEVYGNYPYRCAFCDVEYDNEHESECMLKKYLNKLRAFVQPII